MNEKQPALGENLSFFFNLIISQLFIGSISSIIEFLRIITINILTRFFLSETTIRKYGIYIQPIVTSILLLLIALMIYYIFKVTISVDYNTTIIQYILLIILISMLFAYILWVYYNIKILKQKKQILNDM